MLLKDVIKNKSNDYSSLEVKYADDPYTFLDPFAKPRLDDKNIPHVSIVLPAYNVSNSVLACLKAIEKSSFNSKFPEKLQVVLIDDGSKDDTWKIIKNNNFNMHLLAVRQVNNGQVKALNTGISVSEGDIIISCDPDMILSYYTIEQFAARHQKIGNALLVGFRSDTPGTDNLVNSEYIERYGIHETPYFENDERFIFSTPGIPSSMCLASGHFKNLGFGRGLWMPDGGEPWLLPDNVFGALFCLPRSIYNEIGGYDERINGWGCVDGYLAAKAIGANQYVIPVYSATGLHISHPDRSPTKMEQYRKNRKLFKRFIRTTDVSKHPNYLLKAKDRIIEYYTVDPKKEENSHEKSNDNNPRFWNEIDSLILIGEYKKALTKIERIKITEGYTERIAKIFLGLKEYGKVIELLNDFDNLYETDSVIDLITANAGNGEYAIAHKVVQTLQIKVPDSKYLRYWKETSTNTHINQGLKYYNQDFLETALRCFESALIKSPTSKKALRLHDKVKEKLKI